jgi:hypothetical protein
MRRADSEFWQPLRAGGGHEAARAAESLPRWITEEAVDVAGERLGQNCCCAIFRLGRASISKTGDTSGQHPEVELDVRSAIWPRRSQAEFTRMSIRKPSKRLRTF